MAKVKHLIFEGGGGKGAAYLSVIKALEESDLIEDNQIESIAGSSAGSITALAMVLGYTFEEMWDIIFTKKTFSSFLPNSSFERANQASTQSDKSMFGDQEFSQDGPLELRCVVLDNLTTGKIKYGYFEIPESNRNKMISLVKKLDNSALSALLRLDIFEDFLKEEKIGRPNYKLINSHTISKLFYSGGMLGGQTVNKILANEILAPKVIDQAQGSQLNILEYKYKWFHKTQDFVFSEIGNNKITGIPYLDNYYNSLPPANANADPFKDRSFASEMKDRKINSEGKLLLFDSYIYNLTFAELYDLFNKKLVVTGSNISNGKLYYFSKDDTPDFPVVAAVSISMNIPVLWAPVYVKYTSPSGLVYDGFFVDGGVYNNFPYSVFNGEKNKPIEERKIVCSTQNENVLGFLLDPPEENFIDTISPQILDLFWGLYNSLTDQHSRYIDLESDKIVKLDTSSYGLSMLDFNPDEKYFKKLKSKEFNQDSNYIRTNSAINSFK